MNVTGLKPFGYYNEIDPQKCAWIRELIKAGMVIDGEVDERSIRLVQPGDVARFRQCHWFAGVAIWSYALRQAGWPDERECWTASAPCQPFSAAGQGKAFDDDRHLWPEFFRLVEARRPVVCLGEQVASIDGLAWLDLVQSDLDSAAYTCGAVDLCAAGFGAPHRRQRLYWCATAGVADAAERGSGALDRESREGAGRQSEAGGHGLPDGMADSATERHNGRRPSEAERRAGEPERLRDAGGLARLQSGGRGEEAAGRGPVNGFWRDADWVLTRPQRVGDRPGLRPVESGSFPLADGAPERVGRLRGYGDGIVAPVAEAFIRAVMAELEEA